MAEPDGAEGVERGEVLTMSRTDPAPRWFKAIPGKSEQRRRLRVYVRGKLGDDKAFFLRGAKGKLRLRVTSLTMFLEAADGVDDATWAGYRDRGGFSTGVEGCIGRRSGCGTTRCRG